MISPDQAPDPTVADGIAALHQLESAAWQGAVRSDTLFLTERLAKVCADQLHLEPLARPGGQGGPESGRHTPDAGWLSGLHPGEADLAALDFAVQFSADVASITDSQRTAFLELLGDRVANVAATVFVMDFLPRSWAALEACDIPTIDVSSASSGSEAPGTSVWTAIEAFARLVPGLHGLDAITTELVRLRGARQHQCRLCKSLRSRSALVAGADEDWFLAVDDYQRSAFTPLQKAALALTDAMIWTPWNVAEAASALTGQASTEQCGELVLDITRNALNKIAVALGADEAHVAEGIEIYDVDAEGNVVYGLTLDADHVQAAPRVS
jgi:alkylhydroperoxidase family enzyme